MAKLVAKTYGDALFHLALEESKVDALYEEAIAVIEAFESNNDLGRVLNHPKIEKQEKQKVLQDIFDKFISKDMVGTLVLMVSKDRQNNIVEMLQYFVNRIKEYRHIGTVYVTTAIELTEEQKIRIKKRLIETTEYNEVEMNYCLDTSLIGGMVIRIGDRVVDSSIKTKLDELTKDLRKIQMA